MQTPITVSELNAQIKTLLETTFVYVYVEGEVSRVTYHSSGHLYFSLKDENSTISCVMFRGNNQKLKFKVEEGMKVIIQGAISVYTPRGSYQINCISLEPSGSGALAIAYEQLKKKLEAKGYFLHKKSLPKYPKTLALVTSKSGAALQDMLRVAKKRWPLVKIILIDTIVQGDDAKYSIANSIKIADSINSDIIIVSRGGGSIEDLWAFNEEMVADAIYSAKTPIVSAVGHEIDFLISDFVADLRAPTPSAAMEMILPDKDEMVQYIDNLLESFDNAIKRILAKKEEEIKYLRYSFKQNSMLSKLEFYTKEVASIMASLTRQTSYILNNKEKDVDMMYQQLKNRYQEILSKKEQMLEFALSNLKANDPKKKTKESYAQVIRDKKPIDLNEIKKDDIFELISTSCKIKAQALSKTTF